MSKDGMEMEVIHSKRLLSKTQDVGQHQVDESTTMDTVVVDVSYSLSDEFQEHQIVDGHEVIDIASSLSHVSEIPTVEEIRDYCKKSANMSISD